MRNDHKITATGLLVAVWFASQAIACGWHPAQRYVAHAMSDDPAQSLKGIQSLRKMGYPGLDAILDAQADVLAKNPRHPQWEHVRGIIDAVAKQRDAYASRLFWHTDMDHAKRTAAKEKKPILSLRLLGNLDDELSCANSRFFRTVLYANAKVSSTLRERYVLHWQSVRPVPRITIDFGDGRKLNRTITGNSIHYILDAEGKPIDALPGLYGPKAFLEGLARVEDLIQAMGETPKRKRQDVLKRYHVDRQQEIRKQWAQDLAKLGIQPQPIPPIWPVKNPASTRADTASTITRGKYDIEAPLIKTLIKSAAEANERTQSKYVVEKVVIEAMTPDAASLRQASDDRTWKQIAALHMDDSRLDKGSRELMARKMPEAFMAGDLTASKVMIEDPMLKAMRRFERSVAEDTVRNEYMLHSQIHAWLASDTDWTLHVLNDRVYAALFLTPRSDPWLGLVDANVYTALDGGGIEHDRGAVAEQ
jgi:hypothetical protein